MAGCLEAFPILLCGLTAAGFIATYAISVGDGHVWPFFPYISDTGATVPESCIFGEVLTWAAFFALGTMYIRYKLVMSFCMDCSLLNKIGLGVGFLSCFGMTLVGNFQETSVMAVHYTGAIMVFGGGMIYCFIHARISYKMYPDYNNICICHVRLCIGFLTLIGLVTTFVAGGVSTYEFTANNGTDPTQKWNYDDPGYGAHLASTTAEWVMAISFLFYFLTYVRDFQKIRLWVQSQALVSHLSEAPIQIEYGTAGERTGLLTTA